MSHLTCEVYDATNQTYLGTLSQVVSQEFVDEFNGPGAGTVTVPMFTTDADLLEKDRVVRVAYQGEVRYAWFVETRERTLAGSGNQYLLTASGRGILAWVEDAIVQPQGGLSDYNSPERPFNYASGPGTWRSSGNYQAALGVAWRNDTTGRRGLPVNWKDPIAQWIWRTDPTQAVQRGTVNWFYRDFTLTESKRIKFFASCDNFMEVYLDGNLIMASTDFEQEAPSFASMARFTIRLGVGTHTVAARVRNDKPWERYDLRVDKDTDTVDCDNHGLANGTLLRITDKTNAAGLVKGNDYYVRQRTDSTFKLATTNSNDTIVDVTSNGRIDLRLRADNTAGFIFTGIELNSDGKETDVVVRSGTAWSVSSIEPYWRPAMVLRKLIEEAAARGVYRLSNVTFGFDDTAPTSGSWSTEIDVTLKVGSTLLTVLDDMVDLGNDVWLNPATLELDAWEDRGSDVSSSVLLDTGLNLMRFSTVVERPIKTVALVRTKNGWLRAADDSLRTANGWRETFIEYGNTGSDDVARRNAQRVLRRTGKTQVVANGVEVAVTPGAIPYVNFDVGDVVSIPNPQGEAVPFKARVLSIALKEEGGGVSFQPELEVITTT